MWVWNDFLWPVASVCGVSTRGVFTVKYCLFRLETSRY
jgi:hypothetical protein